MSGVEESRWPVRVVLCRMGSPTIRRHPAGWRPSDGAGATILPGPYAATFPLAVVIDNYGGTGAEAKRNREAGLEFDVVEGDLIELDGMTWVIRDDVWLNYPHLYPVDSE